MGAGAAQDGAPPVGFFWHLFPGVLAAPMTPARWQELQLRPDPTVRVVRGPVPIPVMAAWHRVYALAQTTTVEAETRDLQDQEYQNLKRQWREANPTDPDFEQLNERYREAYRRRMNTPMTTETDERLQRAWETFLETQSLLAPLHEQECGCAR